MKRESFVFYKSFYDSIKELDSEHQAQIYNAIFKYQFDGEISELDGVAKSIFTLILPLLQTNNKRYLNGCKGGKPKTEKSEPKTNESETKTEPKDNQKETKVKPNELCIMNNDLCIMNNEEEKRKKKKNFKKPTIEEISEYCRQRNNGINAEQFYNFYESKDWYIGKSKMKNWQACIRTWEQKKKEQNIQKDTSLPNWWDKDFRKESKYEELARQYTQGIIDT